MAKKKSETNSGAGPVKQRGPAETQLEAFYSGLQQAVNEVDWQNVKLPASPDWKNVTSVPAEDWGEILLK